MENQLSMDDQFLVKIQQIIEENLDNENFSVEDLAEQAGLSRSMLHRKLIKITGKSATDLITEIRLKRAKEMLEKKVATVSEIAYKVGFNSVSYFTRVFKKKYKVSPGGFRKGIVISPSQESHVRKLKSIILQNFTASQIARATIIFLIVLFLTGSIYYFLSREEKYPDKSIAILPFDNLSPIEESQYFADGLVEDLLNRLSKIEDLKVISRTSSEMFRDKGNKTVPEIADILGVKYIMEGSVQRNLDKVRISVQLIDAKNDDHLFSEQYVRDLTEIFELQGKIAKQIVNELSVLLSNQQLKEIQKKPTNNLKAFDYYQIGRLKYCYCTQETVLASSKYFKKAIEADSNYALPYAHLALAYRYLLHIGYFSSKKAGRDSAEIMAFKALELDENLAEAHVALGFIYLREDLNFKLAEKEYKKAIALNPNSTEACVKYAEFLKLTGKPEEAMEYINKAILLDPLNINARLHSTLIYMSAENYKKALEENKKGLEISESHPVSLRLSFDIYRKIGNEKAAYESFRYADSVLTKYPLQEADFAYETSGIEGLIRLQISRSKSNISNARRYIELEENEKALKLLEIALNNGKLDRYTLYEIYFSYPDLKTYPQLNTLLKELEFDLEYN